MTVDAALFRKLAESAREYLRAGDLYAARRYYDQALLLCRQLQEELGVEPHRRTYELADLIRRNQELTDLTEE